MYDDAYDIGYMDGKRGCYISSKKNPFGVGSYEYSKWESDYDDGFRDAETDSLSDVEEDEI